ncbi:DNA polymerase eta [Anopheles bellator]|uniref:DNA polymerase eta n=1 Tax=Anopheles bellator TaxID=139047 RepID=UPI0026475FDB|nr:DNA polymerase eta [Anopheles bellator]
MSSKTNINIKNKFDRVIVLVDMDCFYCQVEEKLNPSIQGKPIAVVQYNPWQGGGIIAVNYPARAKGVTRHMRGDEAKQHCPEIELPQVPQIRGKADLTRYREAGKAVADVLKSFTPLLERASIDEAYLDITERVLGRIRDMNEGRFQLLPDKLANTFAVGYENIGEFVKKLSDTYECGDQGGVPADQLEGKKSDIKLLVGASIVNEIRAAVKDQTGYECSAGVAHNKILAKLTAGFHKPNQQTILPIDSIAKLYETLPVKKVKGLGSKLGDQVCELLKIQFMSELVQFPEALLQQHFDERLGSWMYLMARGIDLEAVTAKFHSKSIGCCKRFPGKNAITGLATLQHWLNELATEVVERLEKDLDENNRTAKQMTVSYSQQIGEGDVSSTRSVPLAVYETERIAWDALEAIKRNTERFFKQGSTTTLHNAIKFLGISVSKFEPNGTAKGGGIKEMFQSYSSKVSNAEPTKSTAEVASCSSTNATTFSSNVARQDPPLEPIKSTKDIKHFLQQAAKLPPSSTINDGKQSEDQLPAEIESTDATVTGLPVREPPIVEPVRVKKDIKSFLRQRCNSIPAGTQIKESNSVTVEEPIPETESIWKTTDQPEQQTTASKENETDLRNEPSAETTESHQNYTATYAEFSTLPPKPASIVTVQCAQCGKQIPEYDYLSHQDFHYALQLSQQQRDEFRSDFKTKLLTTTSAAKPSQSAVAIGRRPSLPTSSTSSIARFLSKVSADGTQTNKCDRDDAKAGSDGESGNSTKCPDCGKLVSQASMSEHLDYHVAKRLQQELNRSEATIPASGAASTTAKRKRQVDEVLTPAKQKLKPVSSYFSKL